MQFASFKSIICVIPKNTFHFQEHTEKLYKQLFSFTSYACILHLPFNVVFLTC